MGNLFTFKFWLDSRPGYFIKPIHYALLILIGLFIVAGVSFIIARKKKLANRKTLASLTSFCFTNVFIAALIMFFAYEEVPVLSARLWLFIWAVSMAAWIYFICRYYRKYLANKGELTKQQEFKKYLP